MSFEIIKGKQEEPSEKLIAEIGFSGWKRDIYGFETIAVFRGMCADWIFQ